MRVSVECRQGHGPSVLGKEAGGWDGATAMRWLAYWLPWIDRLASHINRTDQVLVGAVPLF